MTPLPSVRGGLVDVAWLARHLNDPGLRVLQVDEDSLLWELGHIPGAQSLRWDTDLGHPVRRDVIGAREFSRLMSRLGVGPEDTVVLYGDQSNLWASYAFWVLRLWGHPRVVLLDGGHRAWAQAGMELVSDSSSPPPCPYPEPVGATAGLRVRRTQVEEAVAGGRISVVDSRSADEYGGHIHSGFSFPLTAAHRGGHIPGAHHVYWRDLVEEGSGRFLPAEVLRRRYVDAGVDLAGPIITYCIVGVGSAVNFVVLSEVLGHRQVANYDGSWLEWGSAMGLPIEVG
ncbi:MAG: sulfurtransferase [Acidimicrobiales bacterium]